MKYRPDIDGLRAIAVLPVVLYHANIPFISAGFLGVDVFFVISGFLITSIISKQITEGDFSLLTFYEKRSRRLLPALTLVVLATFIFGYFLLLPSEYRDLGHSAIAAAAFVSNVYFTFTLDYFTTEAVFTPLLHTWSLAVEEQFYLFYPPLLMLLIGRGSLKVTYWAVIILSIISLIAAVIMLPIQADVTFYLIFFRAWELGVGAILALTTKVLIKSALINDIVSIGGILAIILPMLLYTSKTPFPGVSALPPVLGAAALILTGMNGNGGIVNKLLELRALIWIGLISYSLYLWHWPIFTFIRIVRSDANLPLEIAVPAIFVSILISWVSYKYIESPFRLRPPKGFTRNAIFKVSGVMMALMIGGGALLYSNNGMPHRVSERVNDIADAAENKDRANAYCFRKRPQTGLCPLGVPLKEDPFYDFLFWGDSHAKSARSGMDIAARTSGESGLFVGASGCPPLLKVKRRRRENEKCEAAKDSIMNFLDNRNDISTVILFVRWPLYLEGTRYKHEAGRPVYLTWSGPKADKPIKLDNASLFKVGLTATVEKIIATGRKVIILGPVPEVGWNVPKTMARAEMLPWLHAPTDFPMVDFEARSSRTEDALKFIASSYDDVRYIKLSDLFCNDDTCAIANKEGKPLYRDDDHITQDTSVDLLPRRLSEIWQDE